MKTYKSETEFAPQPSSLVDSAYLHSLNAGVMLPLSQALISGLITGTLVCLVMAHYQYEDWLFYGAISALCMVAGWWLYSQSLWRRLVQLAERTWLVDIDGDGMIGEPAPVIPTVRVEVTNRENGTVQTDIREIPYADKLPGFANGLLRGRALTNAEWVGQSKGKLFTADQFKQLQELMLKLHWIRQINPEDRTRGFLLTKSGLAVMEKFSEQYHSPTTSDMDNTWQKRA